MKWMTCWMVRICAVVYMLAMAATCMAVEGPKPASAAFPANSYIEVKVGAYQWGRYGDKPVRGTGPLMQSFMITKARQSGD